MNTQRLYYDDAYQTQFSARILARLQAGAHPAVVLDQTCFYPTGGGQPHDLGTLGEARVLDVQTTPEGAVLHILEANPTGEMIAGALDWARRLDHMQQHTGQHILSRAFEVLHNANTVGFHLSENTVTVDLDQDTFSLADLDAVEDLANQIVRQDQPVRAWFPDADALATLPLRKISEKVSGAVRVVEIGTFDVCACGGTHVVRTGEIGLIKIIRTEKKKGKTRVEFACGQRALLDYRQKNRRLLELAATLTTGYWEVGQAVARLQEELKGLQKDLKAARGQVLQAEAEALWQAVALGIHPGVVVYVEVGRDPGELQILANLISQKSGAVALLGSAGERGHLVLACAEDVPQDMAALLKQTLAQLGVQRGGGSPRLAQSGGLCHLRKPSCRWLAGGRGSAAHQRRAGLSASITLKMMGHRPAPLNVSARVQRKSGVKAG
ncbi:MAG: alanyl-tRNA editing protein [Anaerolineae bacterium]|nr:alanyl-tRNA editing protein [Anaerolineae bacterium]